MRHPMNRLTTDPDANAASDAGRTAWARSLAAPVRDFLGTETGGASVLLAGTIVALAWANSPWSHSYESLWSTRLAVRIGASGISMDLRHWVNEGLMTLFFLVVGLEAKRELDLGELRERRRADDPGDGGAGGHDRPGRDLPRVQRRRSRRPRLGGGDVDRHRLRPRRRGGADAARGHAPARVPADARGRRRSLRAARDRDRRTRRTCRCSRWRSRPRCSAGCWRCATCRNGAGRCRWRSASACGSRCSSRAWTPSSRASRSAWRRAPTRRRARISSAPPCWRARFASSPRPSSRARPSRG